MAHTLLVAPERRLAVIWLDGSVATDDIVAGLSALVARPAWEPAFDLVWDGRGIEMLLVDEAGLDAISTLTDAIRERLGTGRSAVVVRRDIDRAIAKLIRFRGRERKREFRVFDALDEALAWIGQPDLPARPA